MYLNMTLKDSGTGAGNIETSLVIVKGLRIIIHVIYCYFTGQVFVNECGNIIIMCTRGGSSRRAVGLPAAFPELLRKIKPNI
jgi:hypothetical protein